MAILDLQGMQAPSNQGVRYGKSGASKGCGHGGKHGHSGISGLSLLLC